ncbi:hypothetical protein QTI66_04610 [Variovorax sp. J22R133]|uniref:hypothetical protein n=1 Tax=Variovorax brevis TaxID=3053503 RepID=UPI002577D689|nr:hypothetical protein [Variovorax sp. J22R133]MDM0111418.1 hypothetical protein [Variovorax sp. J22R133]
MLDALLDVWLRIWDDITSGRHAPVAFRFILQPAMAAFLAYRAGRRDAQDEKPLYLWALVEDRAKRRDLLREGWEHIGKVFIVALVMDGIYQFISVRWFYPGEALMVAIILAVLPYLVFRSLVNRILRRRAHD